MKLLSINVGEVISIPYRDGKMETGIFKRPVTGPVMVRRLNLDGDAQANLDVHGGPDQAVYVYTLENYKFWEAQLATAKFEHGQFGENLTVSGMLDSEICIGDRFEAGTMELEVAQPRAPCYKLAMKMQRPDFVREVREAGRPGFYCRVIREGQIHAGDDIQYHPTRSETMTVREVFKLRYLEPHKLDKLQTCAALPALAPRWRQGIEKLLAAACS